MKQYVYLLLLQHCIWLCYGAVSLRFVMEASFFHLVAFLLAYRLFSLGNGPVSLGGSNLVTEESINSTEIIVCGELLKAV
mgnify:CR=1 FL=1